ncbi:hypothetical protein SAMN05518846_11282 [Brevibacillus centrosporus]|uniref:Uncharacterized protein n=1 Tax=Brevibacillus centrosporus TaxID=54910 RepID=A0A1I3YY21_9BACL|nr:hypothetical protein SAMN05518846_11282 [Brevibacillus centrosporus]
MYPSQASLNCSSKSVNRRDRKNPHGVVRIFCLYRAIKQGGAAFSNTAKFSVQVENRLKAEQIFPVKKYV